MSALTMVCSRSLKTAARTGARSRSFPASRTCLTSAASSRPITMRTPRTSAFENHQNTDFKPYLLKTTDAGRTWTSLSANLPKNGPVWAIAEDHVNPNLLFTGTEFGLFFSVDGGQKWIQLKGGMPTIAGARSQYSKARKRSRRRRHSVVAFTFSTTTRRCV